MATRLPERTCEECWPTTQRWPSSRFTLNALKLITVPDGKVAGTPMGTDGVFASDAALRQLPWQTSSDALNWLYEVEPDALEPTSRPECDMIEQVVDKLLGTLSFGVRP